MTGLYYTLTLPWHSLVPDTQQVDTRAPFVEDFRSHFLKDFSQVHARQVDVSAQICPKIKNQKLNQQIFWMFLLDKPK